MREYIRPDVVARIPIQGGELLLSPGFDVIHRFSRIGGHMLKYFDCEGGRMHNVMLTEQGAQFLRSECGLYILDRNEISASEHEHLTSWRADALDEAAMGLDFDT